MGIINPLFAQKSCDLELKIISPQEQGVYPYGDTPKLNFRLINHGPDTLALTDTAFLEFTFLGGWTPTYIVPTEVLPGDSFDEEPYVGYYSESWAVNNDTFTVCAHLLNTSTTYQDQNPANDSPACVTFITEADSTNGIPVLQSRGNELSIFPNPAKTILNLELGTMNEGEAIVNIYNVLGHKMLQKKIYFSNNTIPIKLDIASLPRGQYFIQLVQEQKIATAKFLIQ